MMKNLFPEHLLIKAKGLGDGDYYHHHIDDSMILNHNLSCFCGRYKSTLSDFKVYGFIISNNDEGEIISYDKKK